MLNRREFFVAAGVGATALIASTACRKSGIDPKLAHKYADLIADLQETFSYLNIPVPTWNAYLGDLERYKIKVRLKNERKRFLLCTDFFRHGADEKRPLSYMAFYDPYRSPCWNPMAPA